MRSILVRAATALALGGALLPVAPIAAQNFDDYIAVQRGTVALTNATIIDGTGAQTANK